MSSRQLRLIGGRRLRSPAGQSTRPTTSRVREALMNMFQKELQGCRWLDLCSGSGVMGCEALLHGAERVVAIENNTRTAAICRENLELVASADTLSAQVSVIRRDLLSWLKSGRPADTPPFSMVYFDPPYEAGIYNKTLKLLHRGEWVQPEGLVICEHASKIQLVAPTPWIERDRRRYGSSSLLILSPPEHSPGGTGSKQPRTIPEA